MRSLTRSALVVSVYAGALVLALAPAAVLAHGSEGESMDMDMGMDMDAGVVKDDFGKTALNATSANATAVLPPSYFSHPEHQVQLYLHIALMTFGWVFALPVAVMLSLARSRYTLPAQFVFLAANAVGVFFSVAYNANTPDLYPNNAHHKVGWIATWVVCAHVLVSTLAHIAGTFKKSAKPARHGHGSSTSERRAFIPVSTEAMARHHSEHAAAGYRSSNDSGQGTEPKTESLRSNSLSTLDGSLDSPHHKESFDDAREPARSSSSTLGFQDDNDDDDEEDGLPLHTGSPSSPLHSSGRVHSLIAKVASKISARAWSVLLLGYDITDRVILILAFITFALGIITMGRFFEGHGIFNGLAHWIKGGVFFWLGIFNLGRWAGCFGEIGWAWNVRPKSLSQKWRPTAEFAESFLIFFYGITNIFLEHLGNNDGKWHSNDLEHFSITVLFIGGGMCGMLVESKIVRDLLNTTVAEAAHEYPEQEYRDEEREALHPPTQYKFSINPIPSLVILLLGIMMSSHTQASMLSSMVHKQWGNLLAGASFARGFTYIIMYLRPPQSILPSRPPTELLASFGMISGGIMFMASSADTVAAMIHMKMDEMFMYTVTMGLVGMLMSWVLLMIALKGWALRKERGRPTGAYQISSH